MRMRSKFGYSAKLLCLAALSSYAQNENSIFNATNVGNNPGTLTGDYQSIGINPANLGVQRLNRSKFSIGLLETNAAVQSSAFKSRLLGKTDKTQTESDGENEKPRIRNLGNWVGNETQAQTDTRLLGFSFFNEKAGGFAVSTSTRSAMSLQLNDFAFDLLLRDNDYKEFLTNMAEELIREREGQNINPEEFFALPNGTNVRLKIYQEFSLAWGRQLFSTKSVKMYSGVALKYLHGMTRADLNFENNELSGHLSLPKSMQRNAPGWDYPEKNQSGGGGFGADLGLHFLLKDKWALGASVTDLGYINWKGRSIGYKPGIVESIQNLNTDDLPQTVIEIEKLAEAGLFEFSEPVLKREGLPTRVNLGASATFGKILQPYADVSLPMNVEMSDYMKPLFVVGNELTLIRKITIRLGVSLQEGQPIMVPAGLFFEAGKEARYQLGLRTSDVPGFFNNNRKGMSGGMSFVRVRF